MIAYLVEVPRFDIAWLYENYDVGYIFPGKSHKAVREDSNALHDDIFDWASKHWEDDDFLVLTGNLTVMVIAAVAIQEAIGFCPKMLKYNSDTEQYQEIFNSRKVKRVG